MDRLVGGLDGGREVDSEVFGLDMVQDWMLETSDAILEMILLAKVRKMRIERNEVSSGIESDICHIG